MFVSQYNNAANKQQMLLTARIDPEVCGLVISDRYMAIFNGNRLEGDNPTGTASLVPNDQGELLWENCTNSGDLYPRKTDRHPTKEEEIDACHPHRCAFAVDEDAWFAYLGRDGIEAEDGCTYRFDIWRDGRVYGKNQSVSAVDIRGRSELRWSFSVDFDEPGSHVVSIARNKTCHGTTTLEGVACAAVKVVDTPPPAAAPAIVERAPAPAPAPARPATSSVSLGDFAASKAEMQAPIEKVVRARSGQVKQCYDERLKEAPGTADQLSVDVRISSGRVADVTTVKNTTGDAALGHCVTRKIQRWRFPSEVNDSVRLPFTLEAG